MWCYKTMFLLQYNVSARLSVKGAYGGSLPPVAFRTWTISVTSRCLCLSEETLKAGGPFYLMSMPGEVKDPTQEVNV